MSSEFFKLRFVAYKRKVFFYCALVLECDARILEALFYTRLSELHLKDKGDSALWTKAKVWFYDCCINHIATKLGPEYITLADSTGDEFLVNDFCIGVQSDPSSSWRLQKLCKIYIRLEVSDHWEITHKLTISTRKHLSQITLFQTNRDPTYYKVAKHFHDVETGLLERIDEMLAIVLLKTV